MVYLFSTHVKSFSCHCTSANFVQDCNSFLEVLCPDFLPESVLCITHLCLFSCSIENPVLHVDSDSWLTQLMSIYVAIESQFYKWKLMKVIK